MGALEACIREAGYYMMLHVASSVQEIVHLMQTWNVDGLVLTGFHAQDYRQIRSQSQKPMVFVDCYFGDVGIPYSNIGLEDQLGGRLMTEHLIQQGHRRIAFLSDNRIGNDWMRWLGYCEAMEQAGLPYSEAENYIQIRSGRAFDASLARALTPRGRYTALFLPRTIMPCGAWTICMTGESGCRRIYPWPDSTTMFWAKICGPGLPPSIRIPPRRPGWLLECCGDHRRGTAGRGDRPPARIPGDRRHHGPASGLMKVWSGAKQAGEMNKKRPQGRAKPCLRPF